jgi:transposase
MFTLPSSVQVFICRDPIDLRKSFDSLAVLATSVIGHDPLSGHLFVFFNRQHNRVKILFWDRTGYCLYYKRLEAGTFRIPQGTSPAISLPELMLVLEGIDLAGARRRKRFYLQKS